MRLFSKWWLIFILFIPLVVNSADYFPNEQLFSGQKLVLNGKGVRTKAVFALYTAGLYLTEKNNNSSTILNSDDPMALRIEITSAMITSENMAEAVREGFKKSSSDLPAIKNQIEQLIAAFKQKIHKGDVYDFITDGDVIHILKNGSVLTTIEGAEFKQAFFGIWLGKSPVQASLKKALLAG